MNEPKFQQLTDGKEALPEPRRVKKEMLWWRRETHAAAEEFGNQQHHKTFNAWKGAVFKWYMNVLPFLNELTSATHDYEQLREIDEWLQGGADPDPADLWRFTQLLEHLMKDLGVTNIGIRRERGEWGYDYLQGLPFAAEVQRENEGMRRLLANMRNMRRTLRIDTDFAGIIWGPNRVGKDTLAMQLVIPEGDEPQREQFVMNDDDFWNATEQEQYFNFYIPEMSDHFYTQDTAKRSNKKKKRKMKKYAKKNMLMIGCDLNWWKIDQEFVDDKVSFAIRIPQRGFFQFFTASQIEKFERGDERTEVKTPEPAFTGHFPKLTRKDPRWDMYKEIEDEKLEVEREETEEDAVNTSQIMKKIKDRIDHFSKPYGDARILQEGVVKGEFPELKKNDDEWKIVKDTVENDMGWRD